MKHEFKTTLKGDDIQLSSMPLEKGEEIKSIECIVKWLVEPQIEEWGIRYWRPAIVSFECLISILDEKGEERKVVIPSICMYECEIIDEKYKMKDDFTITRIEIDREKETAKAFIQS